MSRYSKACVFACLFDSCVCGFIFRDFAMICFRICRWCFQIYAYRDVLACFSVVQNVLCIRVRVLTFFLLIVFFVLFSVLSGQSCLIQLVIVDLLCRVEFLAFACNACISVWMI